MGSLPSLPRVAQEQADRQEFSAVLQQVASLSQTDVMALANNFSEGWILLKERVTGTKTSARHSTN